MNLTQEPTNWRWSQCHECDTYKCTNCNTVSHGRCLGQVSLVCPSAFHADRVRAAFVRCFANLFFTYRKYLNRPTREQKSSGQIYGFDMDGFIKSLPHEQQEYTVMLKQTQGKIQAPTPSFYPNTRRDSFQRIHP